MITIRKGLDLPLAGRPDQVIKTDVTVNEVAIVGSSFYNLKPSMKVREGDKVVKGQVLFYSKKHPQVAFTAPVSGVVKQVNRGEKRVFQSLVIEVDHSSDKVELLTLKNVPADHHTVVSISDVNTLQQVPQVLGQNLAQLYNKDEVKDILLKSGLWVSFRTRPFNELADPDVEPYSIFVNAHDTNPGHPCPNVILKEDRDAFNTGLKVINIAFDTKNKYVVGNKDFALANEVAGFTYEKFTGPHPAGLVGTHISFLQPVSLTKVAYHLNYQDVIAIGKLFLKGYLDGTKVVALSGPQVVNPVLYRVPAGASVADLTSGKLAEGDNRIVSGSVLDGVTATGPFAYVGQYDLQVSVLREGTEQELFGWFAPQPKKFSLSRLNFFGKKNLPLTTTTNGSSRGMVPIGLYERVMPLDIYPTLLLRDLISGDTDSAQDLGVLELAEEDVALCSFVCQGKYDYALYLRAALEKIQKEG